jgi:hypothetical protein
MSQLQRAVLIPFDDQGTQPTDDESKKISLDFNPETLTLKVSNTLQDTPARKGRQRTQFVGSSSSTLTFDAVFDSTRPKSLPGEDPGVESPEKLDVRNRTKDIAGLLQVSDPSAEHPAPKRVRFSWGSILFDGIIDSYSEVLEFFSGEGVPLRSKVSISIKEQKFEYQINTDHRAALASFKGGSPSVGGTSPTSALSQLGASIGQATGVAGQNGLDSLLELGASPGLSFDAGLSGGVSVSIGGGLDLGVGVDLGFSAGASLDVSAGVAIEVFGGAAVRAAAGGGVDLSASARDAAKPHAGPVVAITIRPSWAPDGPIAGSRASALATIVNEQRASGANAAPPPSGGAFTATSIATAASVRPLPVKGSPPLVPARLGTPPGAVLVKSRGQPESRDSLTGDRPRWEGSPPGTRRAPVTAPGGACCAGCGQSAPARAPCGCGGKRTSW